MISQTISLITDITNTSLFQYILKITKKYIYLISVVIIIIMVIVVPIVVNILSPLILISTIYYWLTMLTIKKLDSNSLYIILWINLLSEIFINLIVFDFGIFEKCVTTLLFSLSTLCLLLINGFTYQLIMIIMMVSIIVRLVSMSCSNFLVHCSLRPFFILIFGVIGIIVARSTEFVLRPVISNVMAADNRAVAWKRRHSSIVSPFLSVPNRRTSCPTLNSNKALAQQSIANNRGKRSLPPNLLKRMSTSTWTTTTSATGMPTLEPEPSRKRSTSFRNLAQSPINCNIPPLQSPVAMPLKVRSYSTTALPYGALSVLQNTRDRQSICDTIYGSTDIDEVEADNETTEDEAHDSTNVWRAVNARQKNFFPRLNLTSDYDSSNDSPSGSDVTLDETNCVEIKSPFKRTVNRIQVSSNESFVNDNLSFEKCVLCGATPKPLIVEETSDALRSQYSFELNVPEVLDNALSIPLLDNQGRYIVDGAIYDLEELSLNPLLSRIDEWDYPIFELSSQLGDTILSQMAYYVFLIAGLLEAFKIPILEFLNYFRALEQGYRDKPYHNKTHAADVLHGVYYLTSQPIPGFAQIPVDSTDSPLHKTSIGPLPQSYVKHISVCEDMYGIIGANYPALELMALYTAAAMHDFDHPGRTNAFLVSTYSEQAILYNDRSVLENHHAASAWSLFLSKPEYNWLKYLDKAEFKRFRFLVIEFILATDLKRHFEILTEFNVKVNEDDSNGIDWFSETDRLLVMEMTIKLADINGPCKAHHIHLQWTYRIAEEFYEQGDEEACRGLPISPFMDRNSPQLAKLQESFINHLVAPLCNAYEEAALFPGVWEYQEPLSSDASSEADISDDDKICNQDNNLKIDFKKHRSRKVSCVQTTHLQENYEIWVSILKEQSLNSQQQSPTLSSDDSSTSTSVHLSQQTLEEIIETEESQANNCTISDNNISEIYLKSSKEAHIS